MPDSNVSVEVDVNWPALDQALAGVTAAPARVEKLCQVLREAATTETQSGQRVRCTATELVGAFGPEDAEEISWLLISLLEAKVLARQVRLSIPGTGIVQFYDSLTDMPDRLYCEATQRWVAPTLEDTRSTFHLVH